MMGSLPAWGAEPWPPMPRKTTLIVVALASRGPPFMAIEPAATSLESCSERTKSGLPKRS